jgi:hypothetical protein
LGSRKTILEWTIALLMMVALFAIIPQAAEAKKRHHTSKHSVTTSKTHTMKRGGRHSRNWRHHGQQKVDARRTQQIQEALIHSHYLEGDASGVWNAKTEDALRRYQAANGWQTKVVPDSRALIKLGLGPSDKKLLNPESAMTSRPAASLATPELNTTPQQ